MKLVAQLAAGLCAVFIGVRHASAVCFESLVSRTPSSEFKVVGDLVTHNRTGLVWARCSLGYRLSGNSGDCIPVSVEPNSYTWFEAQAAAAESTIGGFSDWRLPNRHELVSIVDYACTGPAVNETVFPNTILGSFWTSTPSVLLEGKAWRVTFVTGDLINEDVTNKLHVRLVRDQ